MAATNNNNNNNTTTHNITPLRFTKGSVQVVAGRRINVSSSSSTKYNKHKKKSSSNNNNDNQSQLSSASGLNPGLRMLDQTVDALLFEETDTNHMQDYNQSQDRKQNKLRMKAEQHAQQRRNKGKRWASSTAPRPTSIFNGRSGLQRPNNVGSNGWA